MPVSMFQMISKNMLTTKLNKYKNKNIRLHACNQSNILQLALCRVTVSIKNVELPYSFFVVPGNGPALPKGWQTVRN